MTRSQVTVSTQVILGIADPDDPDVTLKTYIQLKDHHLFIQQTGIKCYLHLDTNI